MAKLDPRLLQQIQQLKRDKETLQGEVKSLRGQSSTQGGFRSRLRTRMKGVFGGLHNPRIAKSKISPLPARFRGRRLF